MTVTQSNYNNLRSQNNIKFNEQFKKRRKMVAGSGDEAWSKSKLFKDPTTFLKDPNFSKIQTPRLPSISCSRASDLVIDWARKTWQDTRRGQERGGDGGERRLAGKRRGVTTWRRSGWWGRTEERTCGGRGGWWGRGRVHACPAVVDTSAITTWADSCNSGEKRLATERRRKEESTMAEEEQVTWPEPHIRDYLWFFSFLFFLFIFLYYNTYYNLGVPKLNSTEWH